MNDLEIIGSRMRALSSSIDDKHARLIVKLAARGIPLSLGEIHRLSDDEKVLEFHDILVDRAQSYEERGDAEIAAALRMCLPIFDDFIEH